MAKSESISNITAALIKFQSECPTIPMSEKNPYFKSSYASLHTIVSTVKVTMAKHGLAYTQLSEQTDGEHICVNTMLIHSSGEWLSSILTMKPAKADPQGLGSAITYARRYALAGILGVVADPDDDGNSASGRDEKPENKTKKEEVIEPPQNYPDFKKAVDACTNKAELDEVIKAWGDKVKQWHESYKDIARTLINTKSKRF